MCLKIFKQILKWVAYTPTLHPIISLFTTVIASFQMQYE